MEAALASSPMTQPGHHESEAQLGDRHDEEPMLMLLRCAFGRRMVKGEGEWHGVPEVLRSSFLLLVKELRRVNARLATLEAAEVTNMRTVADIQLPQQALTCSDDDGNSQQQRTTSDKETVTPKRVLDVESACHQAIDRVAAVEQQLQQMKQAAERREAKWKRRVGRLQREVVNLATMAAAANQQAELATALATTSAVISRRDRQRGVSSEAGRGEEERNIDDGAPSAVRLCPRDDTGDAHDGVIADRIDNIMQICGQKEQVDEKHVLTASCSMDSRHPAVDGQGATSGSTAVSAEECKSEHNQQLEQTMVRVSGCEAVICSNENDQALASSTRDTTSPTALPYTIQGCSVPTTAEVSESASHSLSMDAVPATNGQQRLATLRARYAEARRKQQQSLSQLRAIGDR